MKKNGTGGNSTQTGLSFEVVTDLKVAIASTGLYQVEPNPHSSLAKSAKIYDVTDIRTGEVVGVICSQRALYPYLKKTYPDIDFDIRTSRKYYPDECFISFSMKKIYIVEKKMQTVAGSVDEKLRQGDFLLHVYSKLFSGLGFEVEIIYLLSDWFRAAQYQDIFDFMSMKNISFYFEEIPLGHFSLN